MAKEAQEIYLKLLNGGFRREELIKRMINVGIMLSDKAHKEKKEEFDAIAHEIFVHAAKLAKGQGFKALEIKAEGLIDKAAEKIKKAEPIKGTATIL